MLNKIDTTLAPVENFHSELLALSLKHTQKLWLEISKPTFGAIQSDSSSDIFIKTLTWHIVSHATPGSIKACASLQLWLKAILCVSRYCENLFSGPEVGKQAWWRVNELFIIKWIWFIISHSKSSYSEDRWMSNVTDWLPFSLWVEKSFSAFIMTLAQTLFQGKVSLKEMFLHFAKKSPAADRHTSIFRYPPKESPLTLKQKIDTFNDTITYLLEICLPRELFQLSSEWLLNI